MKLTKSRNPDLAKKEILRSVRELCKNRFVRIHDFPPSLRRKCVRYFGTVRHAKWKAGIIHDKNWSYKDLLEHVYQYEKKHRSDADWPANLKYWAKYYCGSVLCAKCKVKISNEDCICKKQKTIRALTKEDILRWIQEHPTKKVHRWPAHIILHSEQYFGSTRQAKLGAGTLKDERKSFRNKSILKTI